MTNKDAISLIKTIADASMNADRIGLFEPKPITTALYMAIEALEKQIPKKPLCGRCGTLCPSCHRLEYIVQRDALDTHCGFCGQALDWGDE